MVHRHSHWKIMTAKRKRKVRRLNASLFFIYGHIALVCCCFFLYFGLFLVYNIHVAHYGIHSTHQHSQTRIAHPFLSSLLRFKNQTYVCCCCCCCMCFVFLVSVHISAHHFHPFYGFKINQKIRLELFCCIVFSTHYLFCCCYGVFLYNFTIFGSSFGM